jgi:hypothetical protein
MPEMEVGSVITVLTVDEALQHICAVIREQADRRDITPTERDLLMDGAILLAMRVDDLARDGHADSDFGQLDEALPQSAGRHERQAAPTAA